MIKRLFPLVTLILCFWTSPSCAFLNRKNNSQRPKLSCQHIYKIQKRFLRHHILHTKMTPELKERTLDQFIQNLDREKVYFLQSDITNIKRKNKRLFTDLKRQKCNGLYYIYDIYSQRVKERIKFANDYLNNNFLFSKQMKYILDDDLKKRPASSKEANQNMKSYIQYQAANIFLFEKDLKKSVKQVSYILGNFKKQILSWKPQLNHREARECRNKSKDSFKACKPTKWLSKYLNAYSQSLDSHSSYLDNEDLEEFYIDMNLELEGIGATLSSRFGYTVVEKLIPGGAAYKSRQIKEKDKILAVGKTKDKLIDIFGERLEDVVSIIRGKKGTPVFLKISREDKKGKNAVSVIKLIRDKVDLQDEGGASIFYHDIKSKGKTYKIGLLKVPSFYGSTVFGKSVTRDVKKLLLSAKQKKIKALVLDLSNNRGGSLDEAVDLSGLFFARGNVVKQLERHNLKAHILRDRDKRIFYSGPLIVLVNRFSASASEIVSGTLQDYKRAIVVGADHTFGKGSVQSVEQLSSLGALKTTVGLYFIPSGKSTQKEGVSSDIVLPSVLNTNDLGEKNLDYVLPSKQVENFKSSPHEIFSKEGDNWKPIDNKIIGKLKKISKERVAKNEEFQKIEKQLVVLQEKIKNQKVITIAKLLENKNKKDEKSSKKEDEHLSKTEKNKKKYLARPDIQEALNIAKDLALIQKTARSSSNTF